jgi:hypothetical protein
MCMCHMGAIVHSLHGLRNASRCIIIMPDRALTPAAPPEAHLKCWVLWREAHHDGGQVGLLLHSLGQQGAQDLRSRDIPISSSPCHPASGT